MSIFDTIKKYDPIKKADWWGIDQMKNKSGSLSAADAQAQRERQREFEIRDATNRVNAIFDNPARTQGIQDYQNAVRQRGQLDLDRVFGQNARDLKFAMARSGLSSGSADVDLHDRLNDDYGRGVLQVLANAKKAGSDLRSADEASRSRLLGQVSSGYGLDSAGQNALTAARSNLEAARGAIAPQAFDNLFGSYADIYNQSQVAKGRREAEMAGLGTLFNNRNPGY